MKVNGVTASSSETRWRELAVVLVIAPLSTLWWAYTATILWGWFIVPFGIAQIGKAHAWGLSLFLWLFLYPLALRSKDDDLLYRAVTGPIAVTLLLAFGWIAKELMP